MWLDSILAPTLITSVEVCTIRRINTIYSLFSYLIHQQQYKFFFVVSSINHRRSHLSCKIWSFLLFIRAYFPTRLWWLLLFYLTCKKQKQISNTTVSPIFLWEELPKDIMESIIQKLDLSDTIRLKSGCKYWRSLLLENKICEYPLLILPHHRKSPTVTYLCL